MKRQLIGRLMVLLLTTLSAAAPAHAITVEDQAKRIIRGQINKCFMPPPGVSAPYPEVELLMRFNPAGALAGPPQIVSPLDDQTTSKVALRMVSAASRCVTLKVLAGLQRDYFKWQTVRLTIAILPAKP